MSCSSIKRGSEKNTEVKGRIWARKMTEYLNLLAMKIKDLGFTPGTYIVEGKKRVLQVFF